MNSKLLQRVSLSFLFASTVAAVNVARAEDPIPPVKEVIVGINDAFVPGGFDSDADSFVVVSGIFPNGCYRWKGGEIKDVDALTHEITVKANVSQGMCLMVLIPYSKDIRLGKLQTGLHTLRFLNGDGTYLEKSLKIE